MTPGIASIFPPSDGIHHEWMTSRSGAVMRSRTGTPAGARMWSIAIAPFSYSYCQKNWRPLTRTSIRSPPAPASGTFVIPGSSMNTNVAIAARMSTGAPVHASSSFVAPCTCAPSSKRARFCRR